MSASIQRRRGKYNVVVESNEPARRSTACGRRAWVSDHKKETCPTCAAPLADAVVERRQIWTGPYRTLAEARTERANAVTRKAEGTFTTPSRLTFGEFLEGWLDAQESRVRPSTIAAYRANARKHLIPRLGAKRLQTVTAADLDGFYARLLREGRSKGKGLSPKTVRNVSLIVGKALKDAARKGLVVRNVAALADPPKGQRRELNTWEPHELRAWVESVADDRLAAAWRLLATTGMRRGEVLGLLWRNVDLDRARIHVTQTLTIADYKIVVGQPKTAKGRRTISLDEGTAVALRAHRAQQLEERIALGLGKPSGQDLVFATIEGKPVHPEAFSDEFAATVARAGLRSIRLHDVRHSYASAALRVNVHPKIVSERLGHATVAFTLDVYSHVVPSLQDEAAEQVAAFIFDSA